jgi:hypothetical protein
MGSEAFWVPAVLAAVSAGGQYVNQKGAQDRSDAATIAGLQHQQQTQQEASGKVAQTVKEIAANNPDQIRAKATGDYVQQLRRNSAGATAGKPGAGSALAPVAGASARYNADLGTAQTGVADYGNDLASQMAGIDAAVRQRQGEGQALNTLGTNLNLEGAKSFGQNFVDTLRAQLAGQENPWLSLGSNLAGGAANTLSKNMTPKKQSVTVPTGSMMADNGLQPSGVYG